MIRSFRNIILSCMLLAAPAAGAEWAEKEAVGSPFPEIEATDQNGNHWNLKELIGPQGLIFFFNRSTSW